jgi:hypothetical protein
MIPLTASTGVRCQWDRRDLFFTITGRVVCSKRRRKRNAQAVA